MKIVFLDAKTMGSTSLEEIAALGDLTVYPSSTAEEARKRAKDAEVVILNKVIVDEAFLDAAPKLKLICEAGTGINNIDLPLCTARGVEVRNVEAYSTDSVAQITWMHILNLAGLAFHYDAIVKDGTYSGFPVHTDDEHPFTELSGKTLGIVGMGAIGQKVAAIGTAFGMKVVYFSTSGTKHCTLYPALGLEELLRTSDVVSIHAPYNSRTAGLIAYEQMRQMKPSAVLVNTGRGGIAVEADLARALDEGIIAGAALDVYVKEPLPADSPLLHLRHPERIRFSPHIAWGSVEAKARLAHEIAGNIRRTFKTEEAGR
ncbi:MAG: hydroxyacid dehydrogenase [Bacteroidales bacterium]|nr:hydroxyacid dehydrogenase [Bacteroidales bacterium]